MTDSSSPEFKTFQLGDWTLQHGGTLSNAHLAYQTFGDPKNPAIYFIIIPALFGNGQSTSPSNTSSSKLFPEISFYDNVRAQYKLVTEHLAIKHLYCVIGWSMGAGQTYQWITQYPDFMDLAIPFCGSARTSLHNQVFLEGVKSALLAAKGVDGGGVMAKGSETSRSWTEKEKEIGLRALGRVYAGWQAKDLTHGKKQN
ncbi:uncharacterized protein KY384_006569 [Bacidia gigantensis]|uniref:uncharacterized protein n=1 Tax=Bacidia gigantensis TaxID=2732470 RepID=UPI001D05866A|nr:uncharacterized protein KY384_006569 [Bacidia gigantensis]KAG8528880.1 hypothetical protein KY384_006569 [Bacidia gigantensis]